MEYTSYDVEKIVAENPEIKEIVVPEGVTEIAKYAFKSAQKTLESVILPEGLLKIGECAFLNCKLTAIKLPESLKRIDYGAFCGNRIDSVVFPKGIEVAGGFKRNPIKSMELSDGVSYIHGFENCKELESVKLPKELVYSEKIGGFEIGAFRGCEKLSSIELPENLKSIPMGLFEGCSALKSITIPASVKVISHNAFRGCTSLEEFEIPETVENVESLIFCDSGVKKLFWRAKCEELGTEHSLAGMSELEEVYINAETISKDTFYDRSGLDAKVDNCPKLKRLTIGKDTEKIEDDAFFKLDALAEIIVEEGNKKFAVDSGCLYAKGTKRLLRAVPTGEKDGKPLYQISDKVKAIGGGAFPRSVENAEVEFLGKIEKVSDKAVEGFYKSNPFKNNPKEATGGARTVYDAMDFAKAKEAKIEAVKKAGADALVSAALSDWQYGYEEMDAHSPSRKVYRVKLPFGAAFIINMKTKPTQKDTKTVFDTINALKGISDEHELFEKVRELSANSPVSMSSTQGDKYLFEFSGQRLFVAENKNTFRSAEGVPPKSFIEKDIASFFNNSGLEYQISIFAQKENGVDVMPKAEIAIRKDGKIIAKRSSRYCGWEIFCKKSGQRRELSNLIALVKQTAAEDIEKAIYDNRKELGTVLVVSE